MFDKVLVANRGEIAVRVIRALREARIRSVAVYSDADRAALHVRMADEAVHIGPSPSSESYLNSSRVIDAALRQGAQAVHPGYGFLSENADFAQACEDAGLVFIGPPSSAIRKVGSKTAARSLAIEAGAPVVPGAPATREAAGAIGYPVLLKAAAGGGGKGMRRVDREQDFDGALRDAASEALRAFGDGEIYMEKLLEAPRHIEIQVLGDRHGHLIHLGERECSIQRRHQKVIEECPSPLVAEHPEMRAEMGRTALAIARAAGYFNAGTAEFLVDSNRNFYFLEMNTRLQVEHPVTEMVTGLDLVHWQLRIASGERLTLRQDDVRWNGSAIECRIYAEDPDNNFFPSPGRVTQLSRPSGPGVRLDSGVYPGWTVPIEYDSLLAKLVVSAESRDLAIRRMQRALSEYHIAGIHTTIPLFREILADQAFRSGDLSTAYLDGFLARTRRTPETDPLVEAAAAMAAAVQQNSQARVQSAGSSENKWTSEGRMRMMR